MRNRKTLYSLLTAVVMLFTVSGCSDSDLVSFPSTPVSAGADVAVGFVLNIPSATLSRGVARLSVDPERLITNARVLVFEKESDTYQYRYMADARSLQTGEDNLTRFDVRMLASEKDVAILVVANYGDAFDNYAPATDASPEQVKKEIVRTFDSQMDGDLPMYAELERKGGITTTSLELNATMLRAIARVDVVKDLVAESEAFVLTDVFIFRANSSLQIAPDADALSSGDWIVHTSSVPSSSSMNMAPYSKESEVYDPGEITGLYLPESMPVDLSDRGDATCVVIGGYYADDAGLAEPRKSYYRSDFNSTLSGHPFGQVLRNHIYQIKIKKVATRGYSTPEEAAANTTMNMITEVQPWSDFVTDMWFDGQHHLGISTRNVVLSFLSADIQVVDVMSTLPYTIEWLGTGESTSTAGQVIRGQYFDAVMYPGTSGAALFSSVDELSHIRFTTTANNDSSEPLSEEMLISAGRWEFRVTVTQNGTGENSDRIIHVLSIEEVGDLGTYSDPAVASGQALRRVLDNPAYFSASGIVPVGGLDFTRVTNTYTSAKSGTNLYHTFVRLIEGHDVIYLPYNNLLSQDAAVVLMQWLGESPNRVLVVGVDSQTSSAPLVNPSYGLLDEGKWSFYTNLGYYAPASLNDENRTILDGPFGTVTEDTYRRPDIYAGYNTNVDEKIIPVIVDSENRDAVVVGLSREYNIVYLGDAQLNQYPRMSNNKGEVSSSLDVLQANLWAWIVKKVCND